MTNNGYKHTLKSGRSVEFCEPTYEARRQVLIAQRQDDFIPGDDLMAMACLTMDNGQPTDKDHKLRFKDWTLKETVEYLSVFLYMFTNSDDDMKEFKEIAKKLVVPESGTPSVLTVGLSSPSTHTSNPPNTTL